ncbi:MAG: TlpA disulfide reductase family protein [Bacteroidota bacterium]|nr:TlpA disulfide reductase family protein [Bacteroidota bacterium]
MLKLRVVLIFTFSLIIQLHTFAVEKIPVIKFDEIASILNKTNDTVYVLNFWATWCGPCVKELPDFEKFYQSKANSKLKMLLVSLDFKSDYQRLVNFVERKKISIPVVLLDETKYHTWIDKVDPSWEGAIPATLFVKGSVNFRKFHNGQINFNELKTIVSPLL